MAAVDIAFVPPHCAKLFQAQLSTVVTKLIPTEEMLLNKYSWQLWKEYKVAHICIILMNL